MPKYWLDDDNFIFSKFIGYKYDYSFKVGKYGIGYYRLSSNIQKAMIINIFL